MKTRRISQIILSAAAVFAAAVLFVTYGTVLPAVPFAPIQLDGPTAVDSDGNMTVVVDTESRRALILNADGDLTGVVGCETVDSPFGAITDACVVGDVVYLSGVSFAPDSDIIEKERIAAYDKGGNFQGVLLEKAGTGDTDPSFKSLSNAQGGVVVAYEAPASPDTDATPKGKAEGGAGASGEEAKTVAFDLVTDDGASQLHVVDAGGAIVYDAAFSSGGTDHFATLNVYGTLGGGDSDYDSHVYEGHVFTAIDVNDEGLLLACDDETGALCAIEPGSSDARVVVPGEGYRGVHENSGVVSLCDVRANKVVICDASGNIAHEFAETKPSLGFSARMVLVWASGLYLAGFALVLAVRKVHRLVRAGKTESFGPMLLAVAVVSAIAVAVGSLASASYQKSFELRANEINMCADHLSQSEVGLGGAMEKIGTRDAIRGAGDDLFDVGVSLSEVVTPVSTLVQAANSNNVGLYYNLYGKDGQGIYYLCGSSDEYVMGTTARPLDGGALEKAFASISVDGDELLSGRTLRDAAQYRLVKIPSSDGAGVAGVIEIGSRMRSFESSLVEDMAQHVLALLVMVLVVYLAYVELRACGRCLFTFHERQEAGGDDAVAVLTRPFTLAITLLSSIDSVMTVLIARELLAKTGLGASSPLVALPAVMLGVGLIIGQSLYGLTGSRVGLRRHVVAGALAMLVCACLTGLAVVFGGFWLYCAAKLAMAVPFGMLYTLGYSLPRLANSDEVRAEAAGGVKRTDTSAAALGTVLGGYAAQTLGNGWVYVLVAVACLIVVVMALNLLPRQLGPLEKIAQPDPLDGRIRNFVRTSAALALAFLVVLPATVAAGYASFLFPLFSVDLGLSKSDINNIVVVGQLVVFVLINSIDRLEGTYGKWRVTAIAIALLGAVFLLFSVNTTLVWSFAVVALVAVFCKSSDGWKAMWLKAAGDSGVPAGRATGAMFATRSLALVVQPFILGALLGAADSVAVIVIGAFCVLCAALFFLVTRRSILKEV